MSSGHGSRVEESTLAGPGDRVGVVPRARLGDGLITLIVAANLARAGCRVRVWHDQLHELAAWLPALELRRCFEGADEEIELCVHQRTATQGAVSGATRALVIGRGDLPRGARAGSYLAWTRRALDLEGAKLDLGVVPPAGVVRAAHKARVVIHPTSREARRNWSAAKFVALGRRLQRRGLEPHFVVSPTESEVWQAESGEEFPSHSFSSLAELARFLCESRLFIGNDSGPGHLASAVGVPTVTVTPRAAQARRWRPAWSESELAPPLIPMPGASLSFATWRPLLPVGRVEGAARRLLARTGAE